MLRAQKLLEGGKKLALAGVLACLCLVFTPDPAPAQAVQAERGISYLTLRDRIADDEGYYGDERSTLKAGRCLIDQFSLDFLSGAADIAPFRVPEEILNVQGIEEVPVQTLLDQLPKADPFLYIHGYYNGFEKGCRRATIFKENVAVGDRFLWFTWPSEDSLVSYARDEVNLYWSVPDLADTIADLHERFGAGHVDLVAHSLGARGLVLALYEIAASRPELRYGEVVLLAPDIDFGVFRKLLPRIRPLAESITVYTSDGDSALDVSEQLHGYPRLGQSGNDIVSLEGVEVIDVSDLPFSSANGHLYHIYSESVGRDLNRLVNDGNRAGVRPGLEQINANLWRLLPDT